MFSDRKKVQNILKLQNFTHKNPLYWLISLSKFPFPFSPFLFQIIVIVSLCLAFYAFSIDATWNKRVERDAINACIDINLAVASLNVTILHRSECTERLDIKDEDSCADYIKANYLQRRSQRDSTRVPTSSGKGYRDVKKIISDKMKRKQPSETSCLALLNCVCIILITHLLLASLCENIELRTKWVRIKIFPSFKHP